MSSSEPGGHKVLWLIIGPALLIAIPIFLLTRLANEGQNVLPGALIGAAMAAALILLLRSSNSPDPETMTKARWQWGLLALPIAALLVGPPIEVIFLGALAGFLFLFVTIVGINMFRGRTR